MLHSVDHIHGNGISYYVYSVLRAEYFVYNYYNMHSIGTGLLGCKGPIEREK